MFGFVLLVESSSLSRSPAGIERAPNANYFSAEIVDSEDNPTECPLVDPMEYTVLLPHPQCDKYYACSNGEPIEMPCPDGLEFNRQIQVCDWPLDADCTEGSAPAQ